MVLYFLRYLFDAARSCKSDSSNWSQNFCSLPRNRCRIWRLGVLWYTTQRSYIFHYCYCTFVTTLLRSLIWLFLNVPVRKWALCAEFTSRFWLEELAFGRMQIVTEFFFVQVPFKKFLHGCRLVFTDGLLPLRFLLLDALVPLGVGGSEDGAVFGVAFARSWPSCRKLHWSPLEHSPFAFHWQQTPCLLSTALDPLRLAITAPVSILSHFWCQRFVIRVSDPCFSSPSFSIFDNRAPISSDECPCHPTPIRFWVDQTHVILICTDFPGYHRIKLSRISSVGILVIDNRITSRLVSNSRTSSLPRLIENRSV